MSPTRTANRLCQSDRCRGTLSVTRNRISARDLMLDLINLHKRYGGTVALDGCSFAVSPGRIVGFLGPNGSGKSTTMRSIFGLVRLDAGEVLWNGKAIGPDERRRFGYMPEERGLYPRMRTLDQVTYFGQLHGLSPKAAEEAALRWLERLGLSAHSKARIEELSHGNQQRVQLAVALVSSPDLLVLDEPFAGLDPVGVEALSEAIRAEAKRGAAVVFSSHQLDLVEHVCEDVAIIVEGRSVLKGALQDIREASPYRYVQMLLKTHREKAHLIVGASETENVRLLWERNGEIRIQVPRDADPQALLASACRLGEVGYFRFEPPALSDLFREAVEQ
jgi:ABC-2 type transport system ATP-binding protein